MRGRSIFRRVAVRAVLLLGAVSLAATAQAQSYPVRPVKWVVGFAAGGASDSLARAVSQEAAKTLGQPIVIENIAGGGGTIAARTVARAPADGYTLLLGSPGSLIINPLLQSGLPYKPEDFSPVGSLARISYALMVRPGLQVKNVAQLIERSKSQSGGLTVGSAGTGSNTHLVAMSFMAHTGAVLRHVPYKGTAPALQDLMAGNIDLLFDSIPVVIPQAGNPKLQLLAVTGSQREATLPQVPTVAESGWPQFSANNWFGIFAPKKTPPPVIQRLNESINAALRDPQLLDRLQALGNRPAGGTAAELGQLLGRERADYRAVIERAKITLE